MSTVAIKAIVCAVSASDSSGHAGHQCDLRVFQDLGVHGASVISGLTAQNSQRVSHIEITSPASFAAQIDSLQEDLPIRAIKTGLLLSAKQIQQVVAFVQSTRSTLIVDPVLSATSGADFSSGELLLAYPQLIARADLLTPNLPETERLLGTTIRTDTDVVAAAAALRATGCKAVLIKGGHRLLDAPKAHEGLCNDVNADVYDDLNNYVYDYYDDGEQRFWLRQPRLGTDNSRGTGCALASAIASFVALGKPMRDAVVLGNAYIHQSLRAGFAIGRGKGLLGQHGWPDNFADYPRLMSSPQAGERPAFARCDTSRLGLYPIVDSLEWMEHLLLWGVTTLQLRLKDLDTTALTQQVSAAVALGKRYQARVFINDHWQLAIEHGAYGVHLGQEDLDQADLDAIQRSGLRLGLSSHSEYEWLRAASVRPSYIAMGSVFPTQTKTVRTVGVHNLRTWSRVLGSHFPLVAIGGITLDNLPQVLACGVGSAAVVSAIRADLHSEQHVRALLQRFAQPAAREPAS